MSYSRSLLALIALGSLAGCAAEIGDDADGEDLGTAEQAVIYATGTVINTGGDPINVRSGPNTTSAIVGTVSEGMSLGISCQVNGTSVLGTTIWDYVPASGGYVTDAYVYTGYDSFVPGMPICGAPGGTSLVVNGHVLNASQDKWVRWIATNTVPKLLGTRDQRLTKASSVAWWSLKEGVLDTPNPLSYSNCNQVYIGPLSVCSAGIAWQAGIAGVQPRDHSLSDTQSTALSVYPGLTISNVLAKAAVAAGYPAGTSTYNSIVASTGDLRNSWLMREHVVAFTRQEPLVNAQCIVGSSSWCYSSAWSPSSDYAPTRTAALKSISDVKAILSTLAP